MTDVSSVYQWLIEGAPGAKDPGTVVATMNEQLVQLGIPIDRSAAFIRTLHPYIMGRRFLWVPGKPVETAEASYKILRSPEFLLSPVGLVMESGQTFRHHLLQNPPEAGAYMVSGLAAEGFTD